MKTKFGWTYVGHFEDADGIVANFVDKHRSNPYYAW
jgi:hypothetical protein